MLPYLENTIKEGKMDKKGREYEIRTFESADYNSHADIAWFFLNGKKSLSRMPAGHSDLRRFEPGKPVLCKLENGKIVALSEITEFSNAGRPISFGQSISGTNGFWERPTIGDAIFDARGAKRKKI